MKFAQLGIIIIIFGLIIMAAACNSLATPAAQPAKPIVMIASPRSDTVVVAGQEIMIAFTAADVKGISQVELLVDGQPIHVEKVEPMVNSFAGSKPWTPASPGSHVIELRAFNLDNTPSDVAQVFINVGSSGTTAPEVTPPAGDTPLAVLPTTAPPIATAITLIMPSPTPTSAQPIVTTLTGLNVRSGPSTDYPVIGRLAENQSMLLIGRNSEGTWWQIVYPPGSNERGWISGDARYSQASNAAGVPVAAAPPKPTPAPPTPTPAPKVPTIAFFRADRENINPGESVILSWELSDAKEAYLRYDDTTEGVVSPGSKKIFPTRTTVYTLLARGQDGDATAQVTITVNAPTPTPVAVINDGKTKILNGQTIDFDRGVIQGPDAPGADFLWNGDQKSFTPRNGAAGAFVGRPFDQISLSDCLNVTYGQPITGIGGTISGCYRTNESRYGKFFINEWDSEGNLTIQWATWNYR
jgi:hypothetical protein